MALADNALTTVATVKTELGISVSTYDSYIERLVNSVSQQIENYCKRTFKKTTYTNEKYEGPESTKLVLKNYPVSSVTSVSIDSATVSSSDYEVDAEGILFYNSVWPMDGLTIGTSQRITYKDRNVKVTYIAGYVLPQDDSEETPRTLPYDLEDAVISIVTRRYNKQGTQMDVKTEKTQEASITFADNTIDTRTSFTPYEKSILNFYKKYRV